MTNDGKISQYLDSQCMYHHTSATVNERLKSNDSGAEDSLKINEFMIVLFVHDSIFVYDLSFKLLHSFTGNEGILLSESHGNPGILFNQFYIYQMIQTSHRSNNETKTGPTGLRPPIPTITRCFDTLTGKLTILPIASQFWCRTIDTLNNTICFYTISEWSLVNRIGSTCEVLKPYVRELPVEFRTKYVIWHDEEHMYRFGRAQTGSSSISYWNPLKNQKKSAIVKKSLDSVKCTVFSGKIFITETYYWSQERGEIVMYDWETLEVESTLIPHRDNRFSNIGAATQCFDIICGNSISLICCLFDWNGNIVCSDSFKKDMYIGSNRNSSVVLRYADPNDKKLFHYHLFVRMKYLNFARIRSRVESCDVYAHFQ